MITIGSYVRRLIYSDRKYIYKLISAFTISIFSVIFLKIYVASLLLISPEILESFRMGRVYNFGIISLESLESISGSLGDNILLGVLPSMAFQTLLAFFIVFLCYGQFKNGYVQFAVTRGVTREKLFSEYVFQMANSLLPITGAYLLGTILAMVATGSFAIENPGHVLITLLVQIIIIYGTAIILAVLGMFLHNVLGVVFIISAMFSAPTIPDTLKTITLGKIDIADYFIPTIIQRLQGYDLAHLALGLGISIGISVLFYILGRVGFKKINFN